MRDLKPKRIKGDFLIDFVMCAHPFAGYGSGVMSHRKERVLRKHEELRSDSRCTERVECRHMLPTAPQLGRV